MTPSTTNETLITQREQQFNTSIRNTILWRTMALSVIPLIFVMLFIAAVASQLIALTNPLIWALGVAGLAMIIVIILTYLSAKSIASPIIEILHATEAIAEGDVQRRVTLSEGRNDEIGELVYNLNRMNSSIQKSMADLQTRFEERNHELEAANNQLKNRAFELETAAMLNRKISPILDVGKLNQEVVDILQNRFGFYYLAMFLTNPAGNEALLSQSAGEMNEDRTYKAASSTTGGRTLLSLQSLSIDKQTLLGQAATMREIRMFPLPDWARREKRTALTGAPARSLLVPGAFSELAIPLISGNTLVGILDIQSEDKFGFDEETVHTLQSLANQVALAIERAQLHAQTITERDRTTLLYEFNTALSAALDMENIMRTTVSFANPIGAEFGELHLVTDSREVWRFTTDDLQYDPTHLNMRIASANTPDNDSISRSRQLARLGDLPAETLTEAVQRVYKDIYPNKTVGSMIAAPVLVGREQVVGSLFFGHSQRDRFSRQDQILLDALSAQVAAVLENTALLNDIQRSLKETHLLLDISRRMSIVHTQPEIYNILTESIISTGANRCALHMCLDTQLELPNASEVVYVAHNEQTKNGPPSKEDMTVFDFNQYPILQRTVRSQETIIISDLRHTSQLIGTEKSIMGKYGAQTIVISPLVSRGRVVGLLQIEYLQHQGISERQLTIFRTLGNQATIGIENARQTARTQTALAETQTLYRAGRVLARATNLNEILEEALVEFLYSLTLNQGGIVILNHDQTEGHLAVYVQDGLPEQIDPETTRFNIVEGIPYQEILLAGQPFVSNDISNDPRIPAFKPVNSESMPYSILQAPVIISGETVGWIGADSVDMMRVFSEREIDLARAMADQISIAIRNRQLLEQTQRRAEQLQAVAQVGEAVSEMIDLSEILSHAVELIKERFKLYHVSIFVVDDAQEWAVVKASTGEIGRIMVERPHQLQVGSNSIVGYVTHTGQPRIALDVGADKVHFKNPLLPDTRSEMALPLAAHGGLVIGALDVQSTQPNAFSTEDVEILQIMANQLTAAIEKANLFEQTQRRLEEQAILYRIGQKLGSTLDLGEGMYHLVSETALALNVHLCRLSLLENADFEWSIRDTTTKRLSMTHTVVNLVEYHAPTSRIPNEQEKRQPLMEALYMAQAHTNQQQVITTVPIDLHAQEQTEQRAISTLSEEKLVRQNVALAVFPVMSRSTVIAFLTLIDMNPKRTFSHQNIAIMNAIALQAANAVENSKLYQSARENQGFLQAILNQIPDPIFIKDRQRRLVIVNQAFAEGLLGQSEETLLGTPDDSYFPPEVAQENQEQDDQLFSQAQSVEAEQTLSNSQGKKRTLYIRKTPLMVNGKHQAVENLEPDNEQINYISQESEEPTLAQPDYLIGLINDITEQRLREAERERLIDSTRQTLRRTQALYQISHALDTGQAPFETILYEYLGLLELAHGSILLLNHEQTILYSQAMVDLDDIDEDDDMVIEETQANTTPASNIASETNSSRSYTGYPNSLTARRYPVLDDPMFAHLQEHKAPLEIRDVAQDPLSQPLTPHPYGHTNASAMLLLPLLIRRELRGLMVITASHSRHFTTGEIELGQTIVTQLARWLENAQLLQEAEYRTERLKASAEVSQIASSILEVNDLMESSVNLIRDRFNFYYVGLFMVVEDYAVLKAGTGEEGQRQLARHHRLKLGEEGMIGWSIAHQQARIALDVGEEAVHFRNPDLPDTRSEMALPLISRGETIGALTIQSNLPRAFSDEDITLLQTMADQIANAIKNAHLFAQTQSALSETERLYQISQELLSAEDESMVYRLATHAMAQSRVDLCAIYIETEPTAHGQRWWTQKAAWSVTGDMPFSDSAEETAVYLVSLIPPSSDPLVIDTERPWQTEDADRSEVVADGSEQTNQSTDASEASPPTPLGLPALVILPLDAARRRLGFMLVAYYKEHWFNREELRFYNTLAQQVVVALENMRLLKASQKRARREEVIRHITNKINAANTIDEIMQTTLTQLSDFVGSNHGLITLNMGQPETNDNKSEKL